MNSNENDVVDEEMDIDMSSAPTSLEIQSDMPDDLKNAINFYNNTRNSEFLDSNDDVDTLDDTDVEDSKDADDITDEGDMPLNDLF